MKTLHVIKSLVCHAKHLKISVIRLNHTELKNELARKIPSERTRITEIRRRQVKEHLPEPKHGMLGLNDMVWETSEQNTEHELVFRGYSIPQILNELPKLPGTTVPPVEGHFWLLLTGRIPNLDNVKALMKDWDSRSIVPFLVEKLIRDSPPTTPPVEQLSNALNTLQSKFVESYTTSGVFKEKYWEMVLEDCMDLIAKVPTIAALIYNKLYRHKMFLPMRNPHADWASNFSLQLGVNNKVFEDLMRLFMIVYSDLHGTKFSDASCLSGSALSDPYKSYASGLNQLASHKNGFYAHDHVEFLKKIHDEVGMYPTKALITEYLQCKDYNHKEIPGFANLNFKEADPRYTCMVNFAKQHFADDPLLKLNELVSESIFEMNTSLPNVDAISGLLLYLFGIREESFFPVMFGISRSLGLLSSYIWDRALGVPLERKSELTDKKISTKIAEKGTCADFVKTHGIAKSKLMQNTDIFPIVSTSVTNLKVPLKSTLNTHGLKSTQQKHTIDLSTTLPTQESQSSTSFSSQLPSQITQTPTSSGRITNSISESQHITNSIPAQPSSNIIQLNTHGVKSPHQKHTIDLSTTLPTQKSQSSFSFSSQITQTQTDSVRATNSISEPQHIPNAILVQPRSSLIINSQSKHCPNAKLPALHSNAATMSCSSQSQSNSSNMVPVTQTQIIHPDAPTSNSESQSNSIQSILTSQPLLNDIRSDSESPKSNVSLSVSQTQVNSVSTLTEKSQSNSNGQSLMNSHSLLKCKLQPSEECIHDENSSRKPNNDSLRENSEMPKENKKSRHIMLSKPEQPSVDTIEMYSNNNWGNTSLKSPTKHHQSQLMHQKKERTKITSFVKERQPSANVQKFSSNDFWK